MTDQQRRAFLRSSAGLAAALAGASLLPPVIRRALATAPARVTGTLGDIEHVVILMQENRSFDHYFGTLHGVRGFGDPRALRLPDGRPVWYQPSSGGSYVLPFHLDVRNTCAQTMHDLNHDWKGAQRPWQNWDGWVKEKTTATMGYFRRADLPFHYALADAFTICDGYHASLFGPTGPNRMYLFSGSSGLGAGDDGRQVIANIDDGNWSADAARDRASFKGFGWMTYAQRLQDAGVSWKVYQEYDNFGDNTLQYFRAFRGLSPDHPLYRRGRAWAPGSTAANAGSSRGEHLVAEFARDVRSGALPAVSWIVAPYIMSEHPRATPAYGASLIARLLAALADHPECWSKTVFLLNYDENDGFFDHVPAPVPALEVAQGISTADVAGESYHGVPVGLGPRVPMLVISPWSAGGRVNSQLFDHTSVIRLLEARFGVYESNISPWRRAVCGDLTSTLDLDGADTHWPRLPDTRSEVELADATRNLPEPSVPLQQRLPVQETGWRPACALPYALEADIQWLPQRGLRVHMDNRGSAAVVLSAWGADGQDARSYTLEGGRNLEDLWPPASADGAQLRVHGANGFLRECSVRGDLARMPRLHVHAGYAAAGGTLLLVLRNLGTARCMLRLRDHYHHGASQRVVLDAGAARTLAWPIARQHHWYDIEMESGEAGAYHYRLAGHIETGAASRSDPALGGEALAQPNAQVA